MDWYAEARRQTQNDICGAQVCSRAAVVKRVSVGKAKRPSASITGAARFGQL
jgi:hypothetical protein